MRSLSAMFLFSMMGFVTPAFADIAPDPGYIETCTLDDCNQPGTTCDTCSGSHMDNDADAEDSEFGPDSCRLKFKDKPNFKQACRTWGGSFWTEVWCEGPPKDSCDVDRSSLCGCAATDAAGPLTALTAGFLLFATALRRRPDPI